MDHAGEEATPSGYGITLGGRRFEMTGRSHSAIFRLEDCEYLRISVINDIGEGTLSVQGRTVSASNPVRRIYQGKGQPAGFSGHFYLQADTDFEVVETVQGESVLLRFPEKGTHLVKAACSFRSVDGARSNLASEIPGWDFDAVKETLTGIWDNRLSRVEATGANKEMLTHFYGSLWRASLLPRQVNDVGESADYDDFSLWDTYRALHPLLTILDPQEVGEMIRALLRKYDRGGWLPIFPCWGSYTSAMIGDHAISMICDAYLKGIRNFDVRKAWRAMRHNAFDSPGEESEAYKDGRGRRALVSYLKYGYVPLEDSVPYAYHREEQVSRTLEYAYDDWCLSRVALRRFRLLDWFRLKKRAGNWRNVFDPATRYPQGRHADGTFLQENNYLEKTAFITEGTPCHYSWYVPQDVEGLIGFIGREEFTARLDSMFSERRYWHGNEPCHQVPWLYNYVGQPEKTQAAVHGILRSEYRNAAGGLSGNDDAGAMSAWYVFGCLGFYPVCPGSGEYALGAPAFDAITLRLENGKTFRIVAENLSEENKYVRRVRLDGRVIWDAATRRGRPFLTHKAIRRGGNLVFEMCAAI
jgi:predicted alpha-1,2-mannosidase